MTPSRADSCVIALPVPRLQAVTTACLPSNPRSRHSLPRSRTISAREASRVDFGRGSTRSLACYQLKVRMARETARKMHLCPYRCSLVDENQRTSVQHLAAGVALSGPIRTNLAREELMHVRNHRSLTPWPAASWRRPRRRGGLAWRHGDGGRRAADRHLARRLAGRHGHHRRGRATHRRVCRAG